MFKFKSSTKLTFFSTSILVVIVFIIIMLMLSSLQDRLRAVHYDTAKETLEYIKEDIAALRHFEDIRYPQTYFILYNDNNEIIYDGSAGEYSVFFNSMEYVSENIFFAKSENVHYFYGKINDTLYIKLVNPVVQVTNLTGGLFDSLLIILVFSTIIFFFAGSLIVDKILNPLRLMIEKIKSIGNKNFNERLYIDSTDDELVEYARVFNEMAEKINEFVQKQRRFISDASHELVTPITVIIGHTDLLLRWGKEDKKTLETELEIIKNEAVAMNGLIEKLLFFARSDNKTIKYNFEAISINKLVTACINEQLSIMDFEYILNSDEEIFVMGDYNSLKRVLRIIFTNGIKYSVNKIFLTINITRAKGFAEISVSDKGIGIDEIYLKKIFERFFRIDDSRTRDSGGTGLGLAIAKEIVEYHKGSIYAKNNTDGGTTIVFCLPIS